MKVSRFVVLLMVLVTGYSYGIHEPVLPRAPSLPDNSMSQAPTNRTQIVTNPSTVTADYRWRVRVWFVDGRSLEGEVLFPFNEFMVDQILDGRRFYRKITLAEMTSIRVRRWVPQAKTSPGRQLYYFMPAIYRIIPKTGSDLHLDKRMKMLDSMEVRTPAGKTRVYAYFADYWIGHTDDGHWENSGSRDFAWNNTRPNLKTVYRIDFLESL